MNNKILVVLLAILLIIPVSLAFELNSNELTRNICQGNTILFTANVFGIGNFNVNLDGSASSWSTAVPNGFILNNNARTIYVYSTPNNNVAPGKYNLNLIVSNQQETKTIPLTINVENCHNLEIKGDMSKEICGGQIISYNYQIKNLGNYKETYQLKLEGPDFVTLSQDLISLNQGETKNIYAYVGQNSKSSKFTISASNKYGTAEITSELKVNSCYDFTLSTDKDFVNFCEHSKENIVINIKNAGISKDDYKLELIAPPAWANLEKQDLILNPQQSESVNLVLSPDYGVKGNFDVELKVSSKESSKTRIIKTQVNKCNDIFVDIQEKEINLCNNVQVPLLIKNTGSFEKEFRLETSEQWASLDTYQAKLKPGEEKSIKLLLNVEKLEKKSYDIYVRTLALDGSGLSMDDKITINVLNELQCHNTEIISDSSIEVTQGSSITLPLTVKNNGNEKLIYEISLTGDGSSFTQLNPSILELEPNSAEIIYVYSAPSAEINPGGYSIDVRVSYNNNLLSSKNININVKQSEFEKKEYIPFTLRITNFLRNLFPKTVVNETIVEEPVVEEPKVEEPKVEEPVQNVIEETNKTSSITKLYNQVKPYWIYIIVAIIVIVILIFIFSSGEKEEDEDEDFEEEEVESKKKVKKSDEEEKPLKIGRWILGIIVILALVYLQMNYNLFNYAKKYILIGWEYALIYKFYILIALVILLIIILIIKYWGSILEFFEEEEEKPKRKKKKK